MAERRRSQDTVDEVVVPVAEETAVVRKERVVSETVRLHKKVHEYEQSVDVPLQAEDIEVERVPVDRWVDEEVPVRQEGDTVIYPVLKEVLVVEKRLKLVEEVRVTRRRATHHAEEKVTLRREEIIVERDAGHRTPDRDSDG